MVRRGLSYNRTGERTFGGRFASRVADTHSHKHTHKTPPPTSCCVIWGVSNLLSMGQRFPDPPPEQNNAWTPQQLQRRAHLRIQGRARELEGDRAESTRIPLFIFSACAVGMVTCNFFSFPSPPSHSPFRHSICFSPCFSKLRSHPCHPLSRRCPIIIPLCSAEPRQALLNVIWQQLHLDSPYTGSNNYNDRGDRLRAIVKVKTKRAGCMEKETSGEWEPARNEWAGSGLQSFSFLMAEELSSGVKRIIFWGLFCV